MMPRHDSPTRSILGQLCSPIVVGLWPGAIDHGAGRQPVTGRSRSRPLSLFYHSTKYWAELVIPGLSAHAVSVDGSAPPEGGIPVSQGPTPSLPVLVHRSAYSCPAGKLATAALPV